MDSVLSQSTAQISNAVLSEHFFSPKKDESRQYKSQVDMGQNVSFSNGAASHHLKLGRIKLHNAREAHSILYESQMY